MSPSQNDSASVTQVSLPSFQDMFPEYLTKLPAYITSQRVPDHHNIPLNPTQRHPPSPQELGSSLIRHVFEQRPRAQTLHGRSPPPRPEGGRNDTRPMPPGPQTYLPPAPTGSTAHSFDVLKSDPSNRSLEHISSSATFPTRGPSSIDSIAGIASGSVPAFQVPVYDHVAQPVRSQPSNNSCPAPTDAAPTRSPRDEMDNFSNVIVFPPAGIVPSPNSGREKYFPDDPGNMSDDDNLTGGNSGKRHICPICSKRFNRPSSLRIHLNTHTGETPFGCPWPNCGRKFNVNSNMRRHHRGHTSPGVSRAQSSNDNRRRRRAAAPAAPEAMFIDGETLPDPHQTRERADAASSPPISSLSGSEDSEGECSDAMDEAGDDHRYEREEDELYEHERRSRMEKSSAMECYMPQVPRDTPGYELASRNRYSSIQSRSIDSPPSGRRPSMSTSPSPPPSPEQTYTPSAPYVRSFADTRVSTALRPAFSSPVVNKPPRSAIW